MITRRSWCGWLGLGLFLLAVKLPAQEGSGGFWTGHAFFKHLTGSWKAAGELVSKERSLKITEEWEGRVSSDSEFLVTGSRVLDGESQKFRWAFTHNSLTDSMEATLVTNDDEAGKLRFEISYSDVENTMELKALLGNGGSTLTLKARFDDTKEKHGKVIYDVVITGDSGEENLKGTVTHEKVAAP